MKVKTFLAEIEGIGYREAFDSLDKQVETELGNVPIQTVIDNFYPNTKGRQDNNYTFMTGAHVARVVVYNDKRE